MPSGKEVRTIKDAPKKAGINRVTWNLQPGADQRAAGSNVADVCAERPGRARGKASAEPGPGGAAGGAGTLHGAAPRRGAGILPAARAQEGSPNSPGREQDIRGADGAGGELTGVLDSVIERAIPSRECGAAGHAQGSREGPQGGGTRQPIRWSRSSSRWRSSFTQLRITGRGQDLIRYPAKTGEKLVYLISDVGSTDNAPTASQREVGGVLRQRARSARDELDRLIQRDLDQFNRMLREKGLGGIFARPEPAKIP